MPSSPSNITREYVAADEVEGGAGVMGLIISCYLFCMISCSLCCLVRPVAGHIRGPRRLLCANVGRLPVCGAGREARWAAARARLGLLEPPGAARACS